MLFRYEPEPQLALLAVSVGLAALLLIGFLAWPMFASGGADAWISAGRSVGALLSGMLCGLLIRKMRSVWKARRGQLSDSDA
jgi:hypothetical protein